LPLGSAQAILCRMTTRPPLPESLWSRIPEDVRDALAVVLQASQDRVAQLEALVAQLEARLRSDSSNSHKPPSSDKPRAKPAPPRKRSGKKRGGQPGHPKHERALLPPDRVIDHKPPACSACGKALSGHDPDPRRHQVWDLPPVKPVVVEHRFHSLSCPCGHATAASPAGVPSEGCGPGLKAAAAYLTGVAHLSKSQAQQVFGNLLGTPISAGQVCAIEAEAAQALAPVVEEMRQALPGHDLNMDETGWKQSGKLCWLWVAVAKGFTLFHIAFCRGRQVVEHLLGGGYGRVLTTDRWSAYSRVARRQLCWAHLLRDFQALADGGGAGKAVGEELLMLARLVFMNWCRVRDGTLLRKTAARRILEWYAPDFRTALEAGAASACARASRLCKNLLAREAQLWEFCRTEGVEPTNNAAERALRPAVLWRKKSQGTRSEAGSRYAAGMLSVAATCKQQGRSIWGYLVEAFAASAKGQPAPSLLPAS
jgi:transposase